MAPTTATKAKAPARPSFAVMVRKAIANLKERNGSSRQAIEKYIVANFGVEKTGHHLRLALKKGVEAGSLIQAKGVGANGSFKLKKVAEPKKPAKKVLKKKAPAKKATATKKKAVKKVPKVSAGKKATATKKAPAKKTVAAKKPAAKKAAPKAAAKAKTVVKAKPVKKAK